MKLIPLNKGKFAQVDDSDYDDIMRYKWHVVQTRGGVWYAKRSVWNGGRQVCVRMHRQIMGVPYWNGQEIDHKDRNGLNNQRHNLRFATRREQMLNTVRNTPDKLTGAILIKGRWRSQITINNVAYYIGSFDTQEQGSMAHYFARCFYELIEKETKL